MTTYIAVTDIHDRPNLKEPVRVTKTGQPIELDAADAAKLGDAVRLPTSDEVQRFNIDGANAAKAPAKAAAAKAPAKAAAAKAPAKAAAAKAQEGAEGDGDGTEGEGDGTEGMV